MSFRVLSKELQKIAIEELNEKPDRIQEDINRIREWIHHQPHLRARTDDQWLLNFLRGCKFSLEQTKSKIDIYYTLRTALPEFYSDRDPFRPEIQEILKLGIFLPLPKNPDLSEPRYLIARGHVADPSKHFAVDICKVGLMILDILLNEDDNFVIIGQSTLIESKKVTIKHAIDYTPVMIKKIMSLQHAYPIRHKNITFINVPGILKSFFDIGYSLASDKIKQRIQLFTDNNLEEIQKHIPKHVLPEEYEGTSGSANSLAAEWKQKVESYRQWFLEDSKYGTDEGKRLKKSKIINELSGVEGSFRKLEID